MQNLYGDDAYLFAEALGFTVYVPPAPVSIEKQPVLRKSPVVVPVTEMACWNEGE